jgi:ribosomal protein S18 acetylase RimI-like enzyme
MPIRCFDDADFPAVCRIYIDAKKDELEFESRALVIKPLDEDADILAAFRQSDVIVFEEDDIMGFAATFDGRLRALFVRSDARGKGVGLALLKAVLAIHPQAILLSVAKSNINARKFYEKNGFVSTGESISKYGVIDIAYVNMRLDR